MRELSIFIHDALQKGHSRTEVRDVLSRAQWPEDEIEDALSRYAEVPFDVPVPQRKHSASAREAFLYLVTFTALYISAISIGALVFGLIDSWITDPLEEQYYYGSISGGLAQNIASILVSFPLYLYLTRMHLRCYKSEPERRTSDIRRWLTYLTLFIGSCTMIGTLITLLGAILEGELLTRLVLKAAAALVIALVVTLYYRWELRFGGEERL